ncbi:major facilitator superfamily domain-containing protein [Astrocystis sublimbata]|nr:major facilitator superfamily domain-containing protein [Astrocystis sublimbata]
MPDDESTESSGAPLLRSLSPTALSSTLSSAASSISDASPSPTRRRRALALRSVAFVAALAAALGAGSIAVFSLYGHLFQSRLHYTQFQINGIASTMNIAMYLPVPVVGWMCDRFGPGPLSFVAAVLTGGGYSLAAALYRKGVQDVEAIAASPDATFIPMLLAFGAIGVGTACLYLASITTCAKNFGKGKYRGLMLVAPIAAFGLSGLVISQGASRLLYETQPDGTKGDVNVFHFFLFLAILLTTVGIVGTFALRIVDEADLIDEAVEELERSGLLEGSEVFRRRADRGYGTVTVSNTTEGEDEDQLGFSRDNQDDMYAKLKKAWLLNAETRAFLADPTMWLFALSFWLIIGPGESFINNLGTVIGTLTSPSTSSHPPSVATHVSIMATVSTVARIVVASLSDLLSPTPESQHVQVGGPHSLPVLRQKLQVSRVVLYFIAALIFSGGSLVLASGVVQEHANRFWIVSGLIGAGYGAVFSLTPIIITMIWGVENFGTNFGIIALTPAFGSVIWGLIYSAVYQAGAHNSDPIAGEGSSVDDIFCYGKQCYAPTFWAMTVSIWIGASLIILAWKGKNGWSSRGIVI